jgi:hypothetical protein
MAFSGDAVQGHGWRAGAPPIYHDVTYLESLVTIEQLQPTALCMGHTFGWDGVSNDPVRRGPDVGRTLQASRVASAAYDRAAVEALRQLGHEASFAELAVAAFREFAYDLPVQFDRRTIVPIAAARSINAHLVAHGWQPQPTSAPRSAAGA